MMRLFVLFAWVWIAAFLADDAKRKIFENEGSDPNVISVSESNSGLGCEAAKVVEAGERVLGEMCLE